MSGNFQSNAEQQSSSAFYQLPARPSHHRDALADGRPALRQALSVDSFNKPTASSSKMPGKRSFMRSRPRPVEVTPEEFNALPTSIQMKYFSPAERLRIAQQAARQARKQLAAQECPRSMRASEEAIRRPKTGCPAKADGQQEDAHRPRSAHARCTSTSSSDPSRPAFLNRNASTTQDRAIRFLNLPDKPKSSQQLPNEMDQTTQHFDFAPSPSPARPNTANPRIPSTRSRKDSGGSGRRSTDQHTVVDDQSSKTWLETDAQSIRSVDSSGTVEGIFKLYGHKPQISVQITDTTSTARPSSRDVPLPSPVPSIRRRRNISLTPLRLPPPTLLPAVPALPSPTTLRNMAKGVRSNSDVSAASAPPLMTYYWNDPQARSKLREHIQSPEKFDEAIEFGFASKPSGPRSVSPFGSLDATSHDSDFEQAVEEDDRDYDDEDDLDDVSSAITPSAPSVRSDSHGNPRIHHPSVDSDFSLPIPSKMSAGKASIRSLSPDIGPREMTLRMTLTRPDLRAPEDAIYAHQRKEVSGVDIDDNGALALQELIVCDDHSGAQGAFAIRSCPEAKNGGFRKVWKNITRR